MNRQLRSILFLMVMGALINIAVAWTLAILVDPSSFERRIFAYDRDEPTQSNWFIEFTVFAGGQAVNSYWSKSPQLDGEKFRRSPNEVLPGWGFRCRPRLAEKPSHARRVEATARGWPMPALWSGSITDVQADEIWSISPVKSMTYDHDDRRYGVHAGKYKKNAATGLVEPRVVPLVPAWPGFWLNTLLYAVSMWLVFRMPQTMRAIIRYTGDRCMRCGYPIGQSPRCSECGSAVRPLSDAAIRQRNLGRRVQHPRLRFAMVLGVVMLMMVPAAILVYARLPRSLMQDDEPNVALTPTVSSVTARPVSTRPGLYSNEDIVRMTEEEALNALWKLGMAMRSEPDSETGRSTRLRGEVVLVTQQLRKLRGTTKPRNQVPAMSSIRWDFTDDEIATITLAKAGQLLANLREVMTNRGAYPDADRDRLRVQIRLVKERIEAMEDDRGEVGP